MFSLFPTKSAFPVLLLLLPLQQGLGLRVVVELRLRRPVLRFKTQRGLHWKKGSQLVQKARNTTSLNVKDPEAHRLAQAIAQATGETLTRAVTEALRERYERLQRRDPETLAADIRAIARRAAVHIKRPYLDHAELLYDEHGLPK